tara:strand:+ start:1890 stop:2123 length:234 start_codon:yes stop_codon:yes gene_type:complete
LQGIRGQGVRALRLPILVVASLAGLAACGSAGKAQPAEVEISWPDAAVFNAADTAGIRVQDAGVTESADAQAGERVR